MNELQYYNEDDPARARGFRTILVTEPEHPYGGHWWPPGHIIGYEHLSTHAVVDFLHAVIRGEPIAPNFRDGVRIMEVLDAASNPRGPDSAWNFSLADVLRHL